MYRLNLRKNESTIRFAAPTWSTALNEPLSEEAAGALMKNARCLVLIHGYNVAEAMDAYATINDQIGHLYDVVIGLTWPGSEVKLGYWFAEQRADHAGRLLAGYLNQFDYESLDIEGHSCGCRVALEAIRGGLPVRNLILAGAAVDNELVHYDAKYGPELTAFCEHCLICFSRNDNVLARAFRASSWLKNLFGLRKADDCRALGYGGAQNSAMLPHHVSQVDLTEQIPSHSAYKKSPAFYRTWRELLAA